MCDRHFKNSEFALFCSDATGVVTCGNYIYKFRSEHFFERKKIINLILIIQPRIFLQRRESFSTPEIPVNENWLMASGTCVPLHSFVFVNMLRTDANNFEFFFVMLE